MDARSLVREQLAHRATTPIPAALSVETKLAEQIDSYYGDKEWRRRLPNDIVRVSALDPNKYAPVDENHSVDAFGNLWRTDLLPQHLETPVLAQPSLAGYDFPQPEVFFVAGQLGKAKAQCEKYRDRFLVAHTGWGLFERTWTVRGFENMLMDVVAEPDFYEELLDRILALQLAFIAESLKLPVDGIMFSDDWGDQRGVIIGPRRWRQFVKPRVARLYEAVHAAGRYTLSHCCGNVTDIMPDLIEIGLDVLESVQPEAMNPYELKRLWGDKITFWGGLGSQSTLAFGSPQEIGAEIDKLCAEMGRGGGYILTPAKTLMHGMPLENAIAAVESFARVRGVC